MTIFCGAGSFMDCVFVSHSVTVCWRRNLVRDAPDCKEIPAMPWLASSNPDQGGADDAGGVAELMFDDGRFEAVAENVFRHFRDAFRVERVKV